MILIAIVSINLLSYSVTVGGLAITGGNSTAENRVKTFGERILGIVQVVAIGIAIIMLVVLAIKYIVSSPGDKAEIKKHAVVYIVGAIFMFAASGILGIIKEFTSII